MFGISSCDDIDQKKKKFYMYFKIADEDISWLRQLVFTKYTRNV